jgi:TrmH family RNA methyltransferase
MDRISSRRNPLVGEFRALARSGDHRGRVLIDGEHLILEALAAGIPIDVVAVVDRGLTVPALEALRDRGAQVVTVTDAVLSAMSPVRQPSGAVAIARHGPVPMDDVLSRAPQLVLVVTDVQDPGNIGAIIRIAEACGGSGVVTAPGAADPFGWKALRGSMGSAFRVPVAVRVPVLDALTATRASGLRIVATVPRGGTPLPACDLRPPTVVLLGGEGRGLTDSILALADDRITIPMRPPVESLNVATAAAIVLYEAARQRSS